MLRHAAAASVAALAVVLASCSKPAPPQLTVKESKVTKVDLSGIEVQMSIQAVNPNSYALTVQKITGKTIIDGKYDLGTVTVPNAVSLPPGQPVDVATPLVIKWNDLATLGVLATSNRAVPFTFNGEAYFGTSSVSIPVPFAITGSITHQQLADAAVKSIPAGLGAIPGLNVK